MSSRQFTKRIFSGTTLPPPSTGVQRERTSETNRQTKRCTQRNLQIESVLGHQVASSKGLQAMAAEWQSRGCCGTFGKRVLDGCSFEQSSTSAQEQTRTREGNSQTEQTQCVIIIKEKGREGGWIGAPVQVCKPMGKTPCPGKPVSPTLEGLHPSIAITEVPAGRHDRDCSPQNHRQRPRLP
jgi:hypothetical protein